MTTPRPPRSNDTRPLSRAEAKEITRQRLMASAMALLNDGGSEKVSASAVSRHAGVAQSTFYVHFRGLDHLLQALGDELAVRRGVAVRDARRRVREHSDAERVRETFRIPLVEMITNPDWYRMGLRARFDPDSPLGDVVREMIDRERQDLVEDLMLAGCTLGGSDDGRSAQMVADCLASMTEVLARGNIDGRYPDVEQILDTLVQIFYRGIISFFDVNPEEDAR